MTNYEQYDICIIGAGVAGGALAAYLGRNGVRVAVVEKSLREQDRIVGELLQPGGVMKLREMQLEHLLDGFDAQPVTGYALFLNGKNFKVNYPEVENGRGFRNGKFVQTIRSYIRTLPSVTLIEGSVLDFTEENSTVTGVRYTDAVTKEEKQIHAALTVVSDGMFSGFREKLSTNEKKISSYFLGMLLHDCKLPYANHGHVVIAEPSPCLVYPVSSTETRVLIDFPGNEPPKKSEELTAFLRNKIGAQMPEEIRPSFLAAVEEGKFKVMPNHLIPAKPKIKKGAVLLGDSLNMRHPLTGGGMTVALTDVQTLGEKIIGVLKTDDGRRTTGETQLRLDQAVQQFYKTRHKNNATVNILADALYGVMSNDDLKKACYDYLARGGNYAAEPISILSAVSRDVTLLMRHFFAVALYGVKNMLTPFPTANRMKRSFRMLKSAVRIIAPLINNERPNRITRTAISVVRFVF
ncbi:MAG TPA: FAD-dependent monooxygenase [Chitinophagales bacterium]|nr:FAD-dependent monooxygenase [Chitinophagales bacterium]